MIENSNIGSEQQAPPPIQQFQHQESPQPARKSGNGCLIFGVISLICLVVLGVIIALFIAGFSVAGSYLSNITDVTNFPVMQNQKFQEQYIEGSHFSSNKIVVIDVRGIILSANQGFYEVANSDYICEQLDQAQNDSNVCAVILRLDTPGGEVTAADSVHHKVLGFKKLGVPVVSSMGSVAASGGYYIAVASDYIIANRLTTTGSIGVIIEAYNYQKLLNKIGVTSEVYKSGEMKDMLNGARPRTEAEKKLIQDVIDEVYNEFVKIVADGRKNLSIEKIKTTEIGDGRIFSGTKAKELGLIDDVGFFEDAITKAVELAGLGKDEYKVVYYTKVFSFADIFKSIKANDPKISIDMPGVKSWANIIEPGKVYLLPSW